LNQQNITQGVLFPGICSRPVVAKFDQPQGSSDGGAILLRAADQRLHLTSALAQALEDERQSGKIDHELVELVTQRVMAMACGYPDANDTARLGSDPIQGEDLASQSTLARFENSSTVEGDMTMLRRSSDAVEQPRISAAVS